MRICRSAFIALVTMVFSACHSQVNGVGHGAGGRDMAAPGGTGGNGDDGGNGGGIDNGDMTGPLVIAPLDQVLTISAGGVLPTLQFAATVNGNTVSPAWTIDRGEIGTVGVATGTFTPTGTLGGRAI